MGSALNLTSGVRAYALSVCILLLACAACTSNPAPARTATLSPPPTSHLNTHEGPVAQATLPPSWTATFTLTPSRTPSPTPITPTATATPVPSVADVCASFTVDAGFDAGHIFLWDDTITLMFGTPISLVRDPATNAVVPVLVRFLATHAESEETFGVQGAGGQTHVMQLAASRLTNPGYYRWKVVVYSDNFGEQCAHEGDFYVYPTSEDVPATAEATEAS